MDEDHLAWLTAGHPDEAPTIAVAEAERLTEEAAHAIYRTVALQIHDDPLLGTSDHFPGARKYTPEQYANTIVYRWACDDIWLDVVDDLDSWRSLDIHLKHRPSVAHLLGYDGDIPNWDSIRRYWQRCDDDLQTGLRDFGEEYIRSEVRRAFAGDYHPYHEVFGPEDDGVSIPITQKKEAIREIRGIIHDHLDFGREELNKEFERAALLDLQAKVSAEGESINKTLNHLRDESNEKYPTTSGYFYPVKERDVEDWNALFNDLYDIQVRVAKGAGFLDGTDKWPTDDFVEGGKYDSYIDSTGFPFHGDTSNLPRGVTGGRGKKDKSFYSYEYGTISTHADRRSMHLGSAPIKDETDQLDVVKQLYPRAKKHIDIDVLSIDSGYSSVDVLNYLDHDAEQDFLIAGTKNKKIKKRIIFCDKHDQTKHRFESEDGEMTDWLTILVEPNYSAKLPDEWGLDLNAYQTDLSDYEDGPEVESRDWSKPLNDQQLEEIDLDEVDSKQHKARLVYITNIDVPEGEEEQWIKRYKKRWRIENKYGSAKHDFLPSTRSTYHQVRTYIWNFSMLLYNAWVLLDVFLDADHDHALDRGRHQLSASRFGDYFTEIEQ